MLEASSRISEPNFFQFDRYLFDILFRGCNNQDKDNTQDKDTLQVGEKDITVGSLHLLAVIFGLHLACELLAQTVLKRSARGNINMLCS